MSNDKSTVSILMAVYNPRMDWFAEQLCSINRQTYSNLKLYIRDDCSPNTTLEDIEKAVKKYIDRMPYVISRSTKNEGSNMAFQRLTEQAQGDYFAYCDQDDVWLPKKLETLERTIRETGALLVCSDMYIIDKNGNVTADSITKIRRHHILKSGDDLAESLLTKNFVTGCTTLINSHAAKAAVPFCPYMIHDHYLALYCADKGKIISINKPLIKYRVHGGNQTGLMMGVNSKADYEKIRINTMLRRTDWLEKNFPCDDGFRKQIKKCGRWVGARKRYWSTGKGATAIWKYREFSKLTVAFEFFTRNLPESIFGFLISLVRKNII